MSYQHTFHIYDFIYQYQRKYSVTPHLKEIAWAVDLTERTVWRHLQIMETMGMIERSSKPRAITLVSRQPDWDALAKA
jgi:DNA-binding MarR family transcriptional regulator